MNKKKTQPTKWTKTEIAEADWWRNFTYKMDHLVNTVSRRDEWRDKISSKIEFVIQQNKDEIQSNPEWNCWKVQSSNALVGCWKLLLLTSRYNNIRDKQRHWISLLLKVKNLLNGAFVNLAIFASKLFHSVTIGRKWRFWKGKKNRHSQTEIRWKVFNAFGCGKKLKNHNSQKKLKSAIF